MFFSSPSAALEVSGQCSPVLLHVEDYWPLHPTGRSTISHKIPRSCLIWVWLHVSIRLLTNPFPTHCFLFSETTKGSRGWQQTEAGVHPHLVSITVNCYSQYLPWVRTAVKITHSSLRTLLPSLAPNPTPTRSWCQAASLVWTGQQAFRKDSAVRAATVSTHSKLYCPICSSQKSSPSNPSVRVKMTPDFLVCRTALIKKNLC